MTVTKFVDSASSMDECRRVLRSSFLSALTDEDIKTLLPMARARTYIAGATIFYEDDEADAVYFIASGGVEIFKSDKEGKKLPLAVLRENGVLGEMGLLTNAARTATARTLNQVRLLAFGSADFNQALDRGMVPAYKMVLAFSRVLAQRLSQMDDKLFELFQSDPSNPKFQEFNDFQQEVLSKWSVSKW